MFDVNASAIVPPAPAPTITDDQLALCAEVWGPRQHRSILSAEEAIERYDIGALEPVEVATMSTYGSYAPLY